MNINDINQIEDDFPVDFSNLREKINLSHLFLAIEEREYKDILNDEKLFKAVWYKTILLHQDFEYFEIIDNDILFELVTDREFSPVIEYLRNVLLQLAEDSNQNSIQITSNLVSGYGVGGWVPGKNREFSFKNDKSIWFPVEIYELIKKTLPDVANLMEFSHSIQDKGNNLEIIELSWKKVALTKFLLKPTTFPQVSNLKDIFCKQLETGQFCDFTIEAKDKTFKVHSLFLQTFGGEFFQKLLNSNTKEIQEKKISLSNFCEETISYFIDYMYKGVEFVQEKILKDSEVKVIDVMQLLVFSEQYKVPIDLTDCCVNILSRADIDKASAEAIINFSSKMSHIEKLKLVADHLLAKFEK